MRRKSKSLSTFSQKLSLTRLEERETPAITAVGDQFQVNTFTTSLQASADVASDAEGDFVVVWHSFGGDGSQNGVMGRRYSAAGTALSGEFQVNTFTVGSQVSPQIAMDSLGNFVVAWTSQAQDGDSGGIYGQRFGAAGNRVGPEFRINQFTTNDQAFPSVAMDADGDFVVAWQSNYQETAANPITGIFARRYAADGIPLGGEFHVNTFVTGTQSEPDVAVDANGDCVIVWQSAGQDGNAFGVFGQRYNASGIAQGSEFQANTFTTGPQNHAAVGMDAGGNFVVAWQTENQASATSGFDVFQRRFDAAGVPLGNDAIAGVASAGDQTLPDVARSAAGQYVVAFVNGSGANASVRGRAFSASGTVDLQELSFNSELPSPVVIVALSSDAEGDVVGAWSGGGPQDATGIYARRFDESVDAASPWAVSLFATGEPSQITNLERLVAPVSGLVLTFSEAMATAGGGSVTAISNYLLNRNGTNINSQITSVSFAFNNTLRRHEATFLLSAPLDFGDYTLGTRSTINDAAGNAIDGNFDGAAGGSFSVRFRVAAPSAVGPEFRVNVPTDGEQASPAVVTGPGQYVVASADLNVDGSGLGIVARRFDSQGQPLGNDVLVNVFTTSNQDIPDIAADSAGNFVVVWQDGSSQDGSGGGVSGRRFAADGTPLGGEFRANTFTTGNQSRPQVAMSANGDFVVVWTSLQDGSGAGIYAQRYHPDGTPRGGEFQANVATNGNQGAGNVAIDSLGHFIVVWQGADGDVDGIFARRFGPDGPIDAAEVLVNVTTAGTQRQASVAATSAGDFVVAWQSTGQDGDGLGVYGRRFAATGAALGGEFRANTTTTGDQQEPAVAVDADGDFVVAWQGSAAGSSDVFAQRYSTGGLALGGELRVNTTTANDQLLAAVALDSDGDFLVAWSGNGPGDTSGVFAQRFADATPPPRVASVQVNDGTAQRSRVTSLTVTFNTQVTITGALGASFILTRTGGGGVALTATPSIVGGVTVVTLNNFTGAETEFGSLRDGRYTLTVNSTLISTSGGLLDGNGDGIGDDDFTFGDAQGCYRFYGDVAGGNRRNDISDFGFFSPAYLQGPGANNPFLDFNQDGRIDITDFGQFSVRYFTTLP